MFINIWSTPRTGSTWYLFFLYKQFNKSIRYHNNILLLPQFLNYWNLKSYTIANYDDWIYEYQKDSYYYDFTIDSNGKLNSKLINAERKLNITEEENYRIDLLRSEKLNYSCFISHSHIGNISENAYNFLFKKANRNIFLYRENIIEQLSSYAIGYYTKNWHKPNNNISNIYVEDDILKNLADKIITWHKIDKTNSEIIKYEDLEFDKFKDNTLPRKQNNFNKFESLSKKTQDSIIKLNDFILNSI